LLLVVEDDPATRTAMRDLLQKAGYRVACAADGQQALACLREGEMPAAIVLDLNLPGLSGWAFCTKQRQDPDLAGIPVILLSGESDLAGHADSLGAAAYLPKPVEFDQLLEAIRLAA
jgi:CheY-like chemotaxis protein